MRYGKTLAALTEALESAGADPSAVRSSLAYAARHGTFGATLALATGLPAWFRPAR